MNKTIYKLDARLMNSLGQEFDDSVKDELCFDMTNELMDLFIATTSND